MSAMEALLAIVESCPEISSLSFHFYTPHLNVKEKPGVCTSSDLVHHNPISNIITLYRPSITWRTLTYLPEHYSRLGEVMSILSKIKTGNKIFHLPMMDFDCSPSQENLDKVTAFLRQVGQTKGVILSSGRSFHFYGTALSSNEDYLKFLGECLLFSGFTDERYIGHRLIDGCGILRISAGGIRQKTPTVVAIL